MDNVVYALLLAGGLITLAGGIVAMVGVVHLSATGARGRSSATQGRLMNACDLLLLPGGALVVVGGFLALASRLF